jgi:hypothetical protein
MKCRICKKQVTSWQLKDDIAIKITANNINLYFCSQECCKKYFEEEKNKKHKVEMLDKIDKFIKENINCFNKIPVLPTSLFTRINDLYNGTSRIVQRKINNGTGKGYSYDVILATFEKCKDSINYALDNKLVDAKESQKVNYLMAIVENNINDAYIDWLRKEKEKISFIPAQIDYDTAKQKCVSSTEKLFDEGDLL